MIAVLGAGITGLTVGFKAAESGVPCTVFEKAPHVGGMASSFKHSFNGDEFTLDYGPHKIYTTIPRSLEFFKGVLGEDLTEQPKKSKIRLNGKYFDYPIKIAQVLLGLGLGKTTKFGFSFLSSNFSKEDESTYEGYLKKRFGKKIYETIFRDLAEKVWGNPKALDFELAKARLAAQSLPEMAVKMILPSSGGREISAKVFYYPREGFQQFNDLLGKKIEEKGGGLELGCVPSKIFTKANRVVSLEYSRQEELNKIECDFLFSTIPLSDLVSLFSPKAPDEVIKASKALKYRSLILLYLVVDKDRLFDDSFIFFPEKEFVFNRLSEQKAFSAECVPDGKTVLCAEISCDPDSHLYGASDKEIFEFAWPSLEKTGFLKKSEVLETFTKRARRVYPVYDVGFKKNLYSVLDWLDGFENVLTLGRQGLFNYNNTDHCIDMGLSSWEAFSRKTLSRDLDFWKNERKRFEQYVIVD